MGLPFFLIHINRIVDFPLYHLWKPPEMALLENHFAPNGPIGLSSCFPALKLFFLANSELYSYQSSGPLCCFQWIGLRENLQETIDFPIRYGVFL